MQAKGDMAMAGQIFQDMVMEQAIKDKTEQYNKEQEEAMDMPGFQIKE